MGDVRAGQSAVLVVRGAAGVGKTALLQYCAGQAAGFSVAHISGVEAEMELPFAGIHQLCTPMLTRLDAIPEPQRAALRVALGLASGDVPDRFLVALAVLSLLSAVAEEQPLLCLIDDAQWLDGVSGQVLGFVARRLLAESVATVFAVRDPAEPIVLAGLPELPLGGLDEEAARVLLTETVPGRLDERIRDRIVGETGGNPLALLELPRGMSAAELAGGFDLPDAAELSGHIENHYLRQVIALPPTTQRLLLVAAADAVGDPTLVWAASHQLGIGFDALGPAVEAQLLDVGQRIRFQHPLARSAAYRAASITARQEAHRALAAATDPEHDADRRAWHRALAAAGPDDDVAKELESSAGRAQLRGGLAAAAAFLERAVELTPDPQRRADRALAAADAKLRSGEPEAAVRLLTQAEAEPLTALQRARIHLIRGQTAFGSDHGHAAPTLLLAAARELEPLDLTLARDTYLDAFSAALFVGRLSSEIDVSQVAQAARVAPPRSPARPQDLLLDGLAITVTDGYPEGAPLLRRGVNAFRAADLSPAHAIRWLWLATHAAHDLWDDQSWEELCSRQVRLAREAGALAVLPLALSARVGLHLFAGELTTAASLIGEIASVTEATGSGYPPYGALALAAFRGRDVEAGALIRLVEPELVPRGDGMGLTLVEHAKAVLYNGLGRYREAARAAQRGAAHPQELGFSNWSLSQLVEAAVRSEEPALARDAMRRLSRTTQASGTDWAKGVEARCRALVSSRDAAEECYREAIDHLRRTRVRGELARAHLLYGEWLRREGRRVDARDQLRAAHGMFTEMGMEAFADRARRERLATGETVRKRGDAAHDELTPQETQIAHLARAGLTNAGDRRSVVPEPPHRRMAPQKDLRQARDQLAPRPARGPAHPGPRSDHRLEPASSIAMVSSYYGAGSQPWRGGAVAPAARIG